MGRLQYRQKIRANRIGWLVKPFGVFPCFVWAVAKDRFGRGWLPLEADGADPHKIDRFMRAKAGMFHLRIDVKGDGANGCCREWRDMAIGGDMPCAFAFSEIEWMVGSEEAVGNWLSCNWKRLQNISPVQEYGIWKYFGNASLMEKAEIRCRELLGCGVGELNKLVALRDDSRVEIIQN